MATLPTPGGDNNTWGTELNTFLQVAHKSDGTLDHHFVNLGDYCAIDGVTDDSTGFGTAYTLASSLGTGLWHPGGTLVKGNHTILPNVPIEGVGPGVSIFKLKNGANTDLFSAQTGSIDLAASPHVGSVGTLSNFRFANLTLDGNKANQSSGTSYPLRFYGYNYLLRNVEIKNGYTGGLLCDWNGSLGGGMEATFETLAIHDNNGVGLKIGGPHDTRFRNILSWNNGSHGFHIAPNAVGILADSIHSYACGLGVSALGCLCEANVCSFVNCMFEGSDTVQFAAIANDLSLNGGMIFGVSPSWLGVGLQMGQTAGQTPYPGQIWQSGGVTTAYQITGAVINTTFENCTNGVIDFRSESENTIHARVYQTSGTVLVSSRYPNTTDSTHISVNGLVNDLTFNTEGHAHFPDTVSVGADPNAYIQFALSPSSDSKKGLVVYAHSATNVASLLEIQDETYAAKLTVDRTGALKLQGASTFFSGSGAPSAGLGVNGDYYFRSGTPGTANQRIYVKAAGSWTGIV